MTVRLELNSEVEAVLVNQARARGVPLEAYLQDVLEDVARARTAPKQNAGRIRAALDRLAEMGKGLPHIPDSALTREGIYQDHD